MKDLNNEIYYIDMDETLVNSIDAVLSVLNRRYGTNFYPEDVYNWDFTNCFPFLPIEELEDVFESDEFFENLTWKPFQRQWLLNLVENHNTVIIITKGSDINLTKKMNFLRKEGLNFIGFIGLNLNQSKGIVDMHNAILIDDNEENLFESNAKLKILYQNYPNKEWNSKWEGDRILPCE